MPVLSAFSAIQIQARLPLFHMNKYVNLYKGKNPKGTERCSSYSRNNLPGLNKACLIGLISLVFLTACEKNSGTIGLGEQANDGMAISVTDTFSVKTATILLDSLPTSGTGTILLGRLNDPELGVIGSSSFFHLGIPDAQAEMQSNAVFDSVTVNLAYSGYHYGDTTQALRVEVHQLTDPLELIENKKYNEPEEASLLNTWQALYNNSVVKFNSAVLGSLIFKPRPKSADTISIRLANSLGMELFNLAKDNNAVLSSQDDFSDYFKGLALLPDQNNGNSIQGFKAAGASLRLHYSEFSNVGQRHSKILKFNSTDSILQYNRIAADRSSTALKDLTLNKKEISSSETGNKTFVQAGIGLAAKIQFPGIFNFLYEQSIVINKAELIIEVPNMIDKSFAAPAQLILFIANKKNKPQSILKSFGQETNQVATLEKEDAITGASRYVFNLNEYLDYLKATMDKESALLLSVPQEKLNTSMARLVAGAPGNSKAKIKLNIIYTKYDH